LLAALVSSGCAAKRGDSSKAAGAQKAGATTAKLIVTPEIQVVGTVVKVNGRAGFVVLNFPAGHLPAKDVSMSVYRRGSKVGEVKISGWQLEDDVVADLVTGDVQVGDEARE
jgi:hypothetical protein